MNIELIPLENRILKVLVEATPEETEEARRIAAQKLGKQVRVPGFRPGKAPYPILLKYLDPIALQEEAIEVFLDKHYPEILEKENIEPSDVGRVESILSIEPLKLEIHIPLKPLVDLGDYYSIRIPYEPPSISDDDVDRELEDLRRHNATLEPVNRPIQEGDIAYIDLVAYRLENGNRTEQVLVEQQNIPIQVLQNEQHTSEYPFKGFSKVLIGKQVNEKLNVDYSFTEDAPSEKFKGLDVNFDITVKEIKNQILPELNDEFAQSIGEFSTIEELKNYIRANLEKNALDDYQREYDKKVLSEVIKISKIEYAKDLEENERKAYLEELRSVISQFNMDLELYKKMIGEEKFQKNVEEVVESRVKNMLVLLELAKKENIKINLMKVNEDTNHYLQELINRTPNFSSLPRKQLEELASKVSTNLMFDQVYARAYERLRQIAKGEAALDPVNLTQENSDNTQMPSNLEEVNDRVPTPETVSFDEKSDPLNNIENPDNEKE